MKWVTHIDKFLKNKEHLLFSFIHITISAIQVSTHGNCRNIFFFNFTIQWKKNLIRWKLNSHVTEWQDICHGFELIWMVVFVMANNTCYTDNFNRQKKFVFHWIEWIERTRHNGLINIVGQENARIYQNNSFCYFVNWLFAW